MPLNEHILQSVALHNQHVELSFLLKSSEAMPAFTERKTVFRWKAIYSLSTRLREQMMPLLKMT